jgi:hypothetical protein
MHTHTHATHTHSLLYPPLQEHNSTNTTALQKQLDQLVREYQVGGLL